jgi:hypothetical protein
MSNTFNFKSLTISGIAIATVIILFRTVTAYGENNLRATPLINKHYHLTLTHNLPKCEKINTVVLEIQQSGIYLNASLLALTNNIDTQQQPALTGTLNHQQLELSGNIDSSVFCTTSTYNNNQTQPTTILISQLNKDQITGQIKIKNIPTTLEFTALPQTDQNPTSKSDSH